MFHKGYPLLFAPLLAAPPLRWPACYVGLDGALLRSGATIPDTGGGKLTHLFVSSTDNPTPTQALGDHAASLTLTLALTHPHPHPHPHH